MTDRCQQGDAEQRLLVLVPNSRDAHLTCEILQRHNITCLPCNHFRDLCRQLRDGAGGVLLTEEAFAGEGAKDFLTYLDEQPPWSDLPVLFLPLRREYSPVAARALETLGNVLLLERPTKAAMLLSAVRGALRQRRRQYEARRQLEMLAETRQAAEDANQAKSEFLANMSHEIRTPMTVFMAAIEHLLQIDRHPEHRHLLEMADQSARCLRSLIDDILDFSRIEARKLELEETPFDLRICLREAVEMFKLAARDKNLRLDLEVAESLPKLVLGDPERLGQVLINLVGNAIKFTPEGQVQVRVQPLADSLEFSVIDTGIGVPEEKKGMLFKSFSQADASFTRQYGGTGLGLAISKELVELMGGRIWFRDRGGEGSVFTFTLPLKAVNPLRLAAVEAPSKDLRQSTAAARILLAEDDPLIREMIIMMLGQKGVRVSIAETGREAVEKWESGNFDLIFMDLQMPDMNGLEATRTIRKREDGREKHTSIIGLTGHARREIMQDCLDAGMDQVLTKPFQMQDLYSAVLDCISD